jgi:hypothetical protein
VWKSNGANLAGFPLQTNGQITSSAAVGYLDGAGDTSPEIVFTTTADSVYVLNADGKRRPGWPVWNRCSGVTRSPSPALADMNNDGFLDIVFMATNGGLYVYNRNATLVAPWSNIRYTTATVEASESSPIVADINGDGFNDIICGGEDGTLTAISGANATVMAGFPIQLEAEVRGTPAVADIDKDGKTEIVLAGWDKNIYVWDYDFPFSPSMTPPWPQFHHDARRTGFASAPLYVGVDDGPGTGSGAVREIEFAPPSPNPMRAGRSVARLDFAVPSAASGGTYDLSVYDLSGRRVKRVDGGIAPVGHFTLRWDLRDALGRPVDGGVYFIRFTLGGKSLTRKLVVLQ